MSRATQSPTRSQIRGHGLVTVMLVALAFGVLVWAVLFEPRRSGCDGGGSTHPAPDAERAESRQVRVELSPEQIATGAAWSVPVEFEVVLPGTKPARFVLIPEGEFEMGSPETEESSQANERLHTVVLTQPYYLQVCEVTNAQFRSYMPAHDSGRAIWESVGGQRTEWDLNGPEQPVIVSHDAAMGFVAWINEREAGRGRTFALPKEAEWERAARAGSSSAFFWGEDPEDGPLYANAMDIVTLPLIPRDRLLYPDLVGWRRDDGHRATAPVGSFRANRFGLFDMLGNASEWCADWYGEYQGEKVVDPSGPAAGEARVVRGGSWVSNLRSVRCASRFSMIPSTWTTSQGFRLVAYLDPVPQGESGGG